MAHERKGRCTIRQGAAHNEVIIAVNEESGHPPGFLHASVCAWIEWGSVMFSRRTLVAVVQRLIAVMLLTAVGAGPTLATLFVSNGPECTMSCCKRKRDARCCKQHMHSHSVPKGTPLFKTVSSCAAGCAVALAGPATPAFIELATVFRTGPKVTAERLVPPSRAPSPVGNYTPFLYQRPPPSLLP